MKKISLLFFTLGFSLALTAVWLLTFSGFGIPNAHAASFTVCPAGPPTCDYSVIQDAVDAAGDGDVMVAAGTYNNINNHGGLSQIVFIDKSITIRGGYTTAFIEPPDPVSNPAILEAAGQGRVIYIKGDISPTIEGLQIKGGQAAGLGGGPYTEDAGGGVYV